MSMSRKREQQHEIPRSNRWSDNKHVPDGRTWKLEDVQRVLEYKLVRGDTSRCAHIVATQRRETVKNRAPEIAARENGSQFPEGLLMAAVALPGTCEVMFGNVRYWLHV